MFTKLLFLVISLSLGSLKNHRSFRSKSAPRSAVLSRSFNKHNVGIIVRQNASFDVIFTPDVGFSSKFAFSNYVLSTDTRKPNVNTPILLEL